MLGQVIRDHHLARAQPLEGRLRALDAESDAGKEYLHDALWARQFAAASRKAMAEETGKVLTRTLRCSISWETMIASDHNHVALEHHGERGLWVHRKGAMSFATTLYVLITHASKAVKSARRFRHGDRSRKPSSPGLGLYRWHGRPRQIVRT